MSGKSHPTVSRRNGYGINNELDEERVNGTSKNDRASSISKKRGRNLKRDHNKAFILVIIYVIFFCFTLYVSQNVEPRTGLFRSEDTTMRRRPPIPILIEWGTNISTVGRFYETTTAMGGGNMNSMPDFDGLKLTFTEDEDVWIDGRKIIEHYSMEGFIVHPTLQNDYEDIPDDDRVQKKVEKDKICRPLSWLHLYNPNCNSIHEFPVLDYNLASHGYYRDAWMPYPRTKEKVVLKTLRTEHKYRRKAFESIRLDALVMERLTFSPRIADIFGHCGTSVVTELFTEEIEEQIVPGEGWIKNQEDLDDKDDVKPRNHFTATEKLTMALEMAESIADLHGFSDGIIVHDDVQPCQWLRTSDGVMKLNDFNRAEVMNWSEENQAYCKYKNGGGYGQYRSPEEFNDEYLDEKIDIYSLGNNIYALLTGLWNYYTDEDDKVAQKKVKIGDLPFIDDRYRSRSYAEGALVKILERCWVFDPRERADIFEVVDLLRAAVKENSRRQKEHKKTPPIKTM